MIMATKPLLTIDFSQSLGIIDDPTIAVPNGFQDMKGIDVSLPDGVLRPQRVMTNVITNSTLDGLVTDFQESTVTGNRRLYSIWKVTNGIKVMSDNGSGTLTLVKTYTGWF